MFSPYLVFPSPTSSRHTLQALFSYKLLIPHLTHQNCALPSTALTVTTSSLGHQAEASHRPLEAGSVVSHQLHTSLWNDHKSAPLPKPLTRRFTTKLVTPQADGGFCSTRTAAFSVSHFHHHRTSDVLQKKLRQAGEHVLHNSPDTPDIHRCGTSELAKG